MINHHGLCMRLNRSFEHFFDPPDVAVGEVNTQIGSLAFCFCECLMMCASDRGDGVWVIHYSNTEVA